MRRHEVDGRRGRHLCGDDEVAFILPVFIIDQNEHAAIARFVDNFLGARQRGRGAAIGNPVLQLAQCIRRRVPVRRIKIAQCIGMQASDAGKPGFADSPFGHLRADALYDGCAHWHWLSH